MSLIRRGQRAVTNINPHNSNRRILVSNRPRPAATTIVPNIVGLTAVAADAAILGASMVVGTVTGTVDPVATQGTAATTVVPTGTALDYALTA